MPRPRPFVVIPLAVGYEETEAVAVADVLSRAGILPVVARLPGAPSMVPGSHGFRLQAEVSLETVDMEAAMGIFLPGGMPGTNRLAESEAVMVAIDEVRRRGMLIAAICAAPTVLHRMGLLRGRRVTSHPSCRAELVDSHYCESPVVVDAPFVTSRGPGTALLCGLTMVSCLTGRERAIALAEAMVVDVPDVVREEWTRWSLTP
ncbi:DJ-1/PfpI family protein [Candidatus Fermentibacteria bacterium]|nr:DJ-1/PfpI family protein [Candidatus Fermentibacteria bacterium]